ncbi:MAG: exodeoxyribonuclease III [Neomegalonema sp.]
MRLTIATWNINSVRLRETLVAKLLSEKAPDVVCLQETKSPVDLIPRKLFAELGYPHMVARGEKGYNGVAILSRHALEDAGQIDFCAKGDARHVAAKVDLGAVSPIAIHNLYVPAGGDEPDPGANPKFDHKLKFVEEIAARFAKPEARSVLVGDLNIAPLENDVWSHKQLLKIVSHTPVETEGLSKAQTAGGWIDTTRRFVPESEKLYSWWSYRARDWAASDKGRRLDHIWASPDLGDGLSGAQVLKEARGWETPSDHAPVFTEFEL